jgi:hypothetical protein
MLKRLQFLIAGMLVSQISLAQGVKISPQPGTPDPSAILETQDTTRGVLMPRVNLQSSTDALTIANPATSLMVFNTGLTLSPAGFYYNAGTPQAPQWALVLPNPANTSLNMNGFAIENLATPVNPADAVTKDYVDQLISGSGGIFSHYIGQPYAGGVIFHLWKDPQGVEHGLIVSKTNQSNAHNWTNALGLIGVSAQSTSDGNSNSLSIINQSGHTQSAAKLCLDWVDAGYSDWYLPSMEELSLLWHNRFTVNKTLSSMQNAQTISGTTTTPRFWSSTEYATSDAFSVGFLNGYATYGDGAAPAGKGTMAIVRAIRSF